MGAVISSREVVTVLEVEEGDEVDESSWGVEQTVQAPLEYVKGAVSYAASVLGYSLSGWDKRSSPLGRKGHDRSQETIVAFLNGDFGVKGAIEVEYNSVPGTELPKYTSKITYSQDFVHGLFQGDQEPHKFFGKVRNYLENNSQEIKEEEEVLADKLDVSRREAVDWVCKQGGRG